MISKTCGCCAVRDKDDYDKILKPGRQLVSYAAPFDMRHRYPIYLCEYCDGPALAQKNGNG